MPRKESRDLAIRLKMSRNMVNNLGVIGRSYRHMLYKPHEHNPYFNVDLSDVLEILLSYAFFLHYKEGEIEWWPPLAVCLEDFMVEAITARAEECPDSMSDELAIEFFQEKKIVELEGDRQDFLLAQAEKIFRGESPDLKGIEMHPLVGRIDDVVGRGGEEEGTESDGDDVQDG